MNNKKINSYNHSYIIKTERLILRPFKVEDITKKYIDSLNDPKIVGLTESRYRTWDQKSVKEYVKKKSYQPGESILVGIFIKSNKKHIGNIRIHSFSEFNKRAEIGIMIYDPLVWGKGYATEALGSLIEYLFKKLKMHKICAEYYSINKGSKKLFKKLNFTKEGNLKDHFLVDKTYVDAIRIAKFNPYE